MKKLKSIALLVFATMTMFSCSKEKNNPDNVNGKNIKLTVTVTGVNKSESDFISFVVAGGTFSHAKTVWKVNGVVRSNEEVISLAVDDFTGSTKTYVIESITPLDVTQVSMQFINFGADYKISYKAEINGKVEKNDENITVGVDKDYTRTFSY